MYQTTKFSRIVSAATDEYVEVFKHIYPKATIPAPGRKELEYMIYTYCAAATDGCIVEIDGMCQHGHPSWFLKLGLV